MYTFNFLRTKKLFKKYKLEIRNQKIRNERDFAIYVDIFLIHI